MASDISSLSRLSTPQPTGMPLSPSQMPKVVEEGVGGMTEKAVVTAGHSNATRNDPQRPRAASLTSGSETEQTRQTDQIDQTGRNANDPSATDPNDPKLREKLEQAIDKINKMMGNRSSLNFQVDDEYDKMVIRVVDTETDEVIRQIPSKEALKFAEYVEGLAGLIFNDKA